jgi:hypothetical protein
LQGEIHGCEDNEIWDPFAEFCREIYCSADFQLDGLECVVTTPGVGNETSANSTNIYGIDTSRIKLGMTIVVTTSQNPCNTVTSITKSLPYAMAPFADVDPSRFQNVTAEFVGTRSSRESTVYNFEVTFVLVEPPEGSNEPSNDRVVSLMTHALSMNVFIFWIGHVEMKVTGIKEKPVLVEPEEIQKWCR